MKSFLVRDKYPVIRWSLLPDGTFFEGPLPEGYNLAIVPSGDYIVIDIDRHGTIDGFKIIPLELKPELFNTLNYQTRNNGMHFWFKYKGNKPLGNKSSGQGIDLRVGFKGYVVWYPEKDIRDCLDEIQTSSKEMNKWLEKLFSYIK